MARTKKSNVETIEIQEVITPQESLQGITPEDIPPVIDVVKTICKGDIIKYLNEHPECPASVMAISESYKSQGYNVINL